MRINYLCQLSINYASQRIMVYFPPIHMIQATNVLLHFPIDQANSKWFKTHSTLQDGSLVKIGTYLLSMDDIYLEETTYVDDQFTVQCSSSQCIIVQKNMKAQKFHKVVRDYSSSHHVFQQGLLEFVFYCKFPHFLTCPRSM